MSRLRQMQQVELRGRVGVAALLWQYGMYGVAFLIFAVCSSFGILVSEQLSFVPDLSFLKNYHPVDSIEIYDKNDNLVTTINRSDNRHAVDLKHVSLDMQHALIAAEDHRFYDHKGINAVSIVRAMLVNAVAGHTVEGGSTITQQLVKNVFFADAQRTLVRKTAEAIVASEIENRYSKAEILTMYLNEVYFGNGARGIGQAAQVYFGKSAAQLNLAESAYLAAMVKAPSFYGSSEHQADAINRKNYIIDEMVKCGFVSANQAKNAKQTEMAIDITPDENDALPFDKYPYYVSYVLDTVKRAYNPGLIHRRGLRVYTNLDPAAQEAAEALLPQAIKSAPHGIDEEAIVSVGVKDGAVRAIVGGAGNYWQNQWNCAIAPHTVGSAFKPFVYLTAFLDGSLSPRDKIEDAQLTVRQTGSDPWSPKNFDGKYRGKITVKEALAQSRNTCAVRAAQMVGINNVAKTANEAGLYLNGCQNLSLALGSCAQSPLDMASAYGTFARGGIAIKPWAIRRVDDLSGHTLQQCQPVACRVFPQDRVAEIVDILQDVVTGGTGTQARLGDRPAAGKTGTADQARDLWFVGFTPDMVTAVWGGNRLNQPITDKHVSGGSVIARVWHDYNKQYYARVPTPAGSFIAARARVTPDKQIAHEQSRLYSSHRTAYIAHHSRSEEASRSWYGPDNGVVTRNTKGITEYAWTQ